MNERDYLRRVSCVMLCGMVIVAMIGLTQSNGWTKTSRNQFPQPGSAALRSHPPNRIGIIFPQPGDGLPYAFLPIDLQQAFYSTSLVRKDHLQVVLLDNPEAIDDALTRGASEYLAIINPLGEFFQVKNEKDIAPMLARIKNYIEQGGSWWATGGYSFYYAAWRDGNGSASNGWNHETYGVKGLDSLGLKFNVGPDSEPSSLAVTVLGREIIASNWTKFIDKERADANRAPNWREAGAVLIQTEDRPYVSACKIGKGLLWHISGTSNSASVLFPCIMGSCQYLWTHVIPEEAFLNHSRPSEGRPKLETAQIEKRHKIRELPDMEYARAEGTSLRLDLYLPENVKGKIPVIVWVHGGGWEAGNRKNPPGLELVSKGYALASVEYRLSQEATFPAQLYDIKAAIRWLRAHAMKYGLDPDHFGAWGHSAGGHLVAMIGTTGNVKALEGMEGGNLEYSSAVQCVSDWAGPTDFLTDPSETGPNSAASKLIGAPVERNKALARRASPVTYVSKSDHPFLIVHGEMDRLVPIGQARELYTALRKAGVPATLVVRPFTDHGINDPMVMWLQERFFDKYLKPRISSRVRG